MEPEDLRGRRFAWRVEAASPLGAPLREEGYPCGRIFRAPGQHGVARAEFAGARWRLEHAPGVIGPISNLPPMTFRGY